MTTTSIQPAEETRTRKLKVGVVGLGVAAAETVRTLGNTPYIELVAASDVRPQALETFQQRYGGKTYDTIEGICSDPDVELIWVATPNKFHRDHVVTAANHGKHVSVEKPMATSLKEAEEMIKAAEDNHVLLVSGRTGSTNAAIQAMRKVITSGEIGPVRGIQVFAYTDWMLLPRLPDEVNLSLGGGIIYRQAPHQLDSIRLLGGGMVKSVRASIGQWMPERPAPGYYTALLEFEDGTPASVTYNGYGYFMTGELVPWSGFKRTVENPGEVRKALRDGTFDDITAKEARRFGGGRDTSAPAPSEGPKRARYRSDVGFVIVNCEHGDIRQSPNGIWVYDDAGQREIEVDAGPEGGLLEVNEIYDAITKKKPVHQDGRWGMATLEVILGVIQSGQEHREVTMSHQAPAYM